MSRPRSCLLHLSTPFLVLSAFVVEVVGVAEERTCAGDSEVSVHIQVNAENRSVLGIFRLCVCLFHNGNMEIVVAVTMMQCRLAFLPFRREVGCWWHVFIREDVFSFDSSVHSGKRGILVVVRDCVEIVDDRIGRKLWFGRVFTLFAFFSTGIECIGGPVPSGTHEVGVEFVGRFAYFVVGSLVKFGFRRDDVAVFCTVPAVVCDHLSGLLETVYRLLEQVMGIIVYIEFHDGSTSKLHSSVPFCSSINITETNTYCRGVGRAVASGLWYGAYAIPSALFAPRFRQGVGTLVTHGKGGIPSLTQDGRPGSAGPGW